MKTKRQAGKKPSVSARLSPRTHFLISRQKEKKREGLRHGARREGDLAWGKRKEGSAIVERTELLLDMLRPIPITIQTTAKTPGEGKRRGGSREKGKRWREREAHRGINDKKVHPSCRPGKGRRC